MEEIDWNARELMEFVAWALVERVETVASCCPDAGRAKIPDNRRSGLSLGAVESLMLEVAFEYELGLSLMSLRRPSWPSASEWSSVDSGGSSQDCDESRWDSGEFALGNSERAWMRRRCTSALKLLSSPEAGAAPTTSFIGCAASHVSESQRKTCGIKEHTERGKRLVVDLVDDAKICRIST